LSSPLFPCLLFSSLSLPFPSPHFSSLSGFRALSGHHCYQEGTPTPAGQCVLHGFPWLCAEHMGRAVPCWLSEEIMQNMRGKLYKPWFSV
jgi:hypothetical protein